MAEKLRAHQYKVGETEPRQRGRYPPKTIGVVRGDVVNETFEGIIGVKTSKWYVYSEQELLVNYYETRGTYAVHQKELLSEEDTKKEAVKKAEKKVP